MHRLKDIHTFTSSVLGCTILGVLGVLSQARWWSCFDDPTQVFALWVFGTLALLSGLVGTVLLRHYGHGERWNYWVERLVRYVFLYVIMSEVLVRIGGAFYTSTLMTQELRIIDLKPQTFAALFQGFNPAYQCIGGYVLLVGCIGICFRETQRIGMLLLLGSIGHLMLIAHYFDSCYSMKYGIYLSVVLYFLYNDIFEFFAYAARSAPIITDRWKPKRLSDHLYKASTMFKAIVLLAFVLFHHTKVVDMKKKQDTGDNPVAGIWEVQHIDYLTGNMPKRIQEDLATFDKIILDKDRRNGAIKIDNQLSYFQYILDPKYNQLEFWKFNDYRHLELRGKYQMVSPDTMLYIGRNNMDTVRITLTLDQ